VREAHHALQRLLVSLQGWLVGQEGIVSWLGRDILGKMAGLFLIFCIFLAAFGPSLAPYGPFEATFHDDGQLVRLEPPSKQHPLGTNHFGQDILSQLLYGTRVTILVGVVAALCGAAIGTAVALFAGYYGGWLDHILMRLADVAYGVPFLPFAILWVALFGPSMSNIVVVISLFLWRTTARVIRSQVLALKERPFILAARAAGASDLWIIWFQILPNVLPFSFLYASFGIAWAVLMEANLSFLGFGDPRVTSWGQILKVAFQAGVMRRAWWWVLPPGIALSLLVLSTFLVSRSYEEAVNPRLREM
jgi:peptide/nickel transport system permease protein